MTPVAAAAPVAALVPEQADIDTVTAILHVAARYRHLVDTGLPAQSARIVPGHCPDGLPTVTVQIPPAALADWCHRLRVGLVRVHTGDHGVRVHTGAVRDHVRLQVHTRLAALPAGLTVDWIRRPSTTAGGDGWARVDAVAAALEEAA